MTLKAKIFAKFANLYFSRMSSEERIVRLGLNTSPNKISDIVVMPASEFYVRHLTKNLNVKSFGYTWRSKNPDYSLVSSGIGAPSAAFYIEILRRANVKVIVRVDFAGSINPSLKSGDFFVPIRAVNADGTSKIYDPESKESYPDDGLKNLIKETLMKLNVPYKEGVIYSHDAIFKEDAEFIKQLKQNDIDAIDMETAVLYTLGKQFNIKTCSLLIISNSAEEGFEKEISTVTAEFFDALDLSVKIIPEIIKAIRHAGL